MTRKQRLTLSCAITIVCVASFALTPEARSAAPTVIYSFAKKGPLGLNPTGTLLADKNGVLYGGTFQGAPNESIGGSVFSLTPPASGQTAWTPAALYTFSPGFIVESGLVADANGDLYGTATYSQGPGLVFELLPPAKQAGTWTMKTLYVFKGAPDGDTPDGGMIFDTAGSLYGTTLKGGPSTGGTVFKLTPPQAGGTTWTETILYNPRNSNSQISYIPGAPLVFDNAGDLYGISPVDVVPGQRNTAFKLSPPPQGKTAWTPTIIEIFNGKEGASANTGLVIAPDGLLYGITHQGAAHHCGAVFSLGPKKNGGDEYAAKAIYSLNPAQSGCRSSYSPVMDHNGNLYAMTTPTRKSPGAVFEVSPPAGGKGLWTEKTVASFGGAQEDGSYPGGALTFGYGGALYGTASNGGSGGYGTVYAVTP